MHDKNRHYPVIDVEWDLNKARDTIASIALDAIQVFDPVEKWPLHPMDEFCGSDLYMGTAGAFWAIDYLNQVGAIKIDFDIEPYLDELIKTNQEWFKTGPHPDSSSYLFGELPILMLQYKLSKQESLLEKIHTSVRKNESQPLRELMWGAAGTMLAANYLYEWTSQSRWKDTFLVQATRLLDEWEKIPGAGYLWSPELYGGREKYLGPVHGFAGNVIPLLKGREHLPEDQFELICSRVMETVVNTAVPNATYANWPAVFTAQDSNGKSALVQHCHGAPGIINALSEMPVGKNSDFDHLLEKAGELTWFAGPLKKGSNLCHGTAGNGCAFLKLYKRTKNTLWLKRARGFAMLAINQYELAKELYHRGRYTLWTGDLGLAIYLWDCIEEEARFPTIDIF